MNAALRRSMRFDEPAVGVEVFAAHSGPNLTILVGMPKE
jgi:hypothetical protein